MKMKSLMAAMAVGMCLMQACTTEKTIHLKLVETSDVHGAFFDYDFRNGGIMHSGLSRISSYLKENRDTLGDRLIYLDNGDILQGQSVVYFFNYMDSAQVHPTAQMLDYMGCVAGSAGNHDIETGHDVYDKFFSQCKHPVLGANIIDRKTGKPYLKPYTILEREGVKIAILGMISPAIPKWLPGTLWKGLEFQDMRECARQWMPVLKNKEKADLIIGLFHSGTDSEADTNEGEAIEDASLLVAQQIPGFDIIFYGHDHTQACTEVTNCEGEKVLCLNPANNGSYLSVADVTITKKGNALVSKAITADVKHMKDYAVDKDFEARFRPDKERALAFIDEKIGVLTEPLDGKEAFFGPCKFISLIHQLQMDITGASISITAPLSLNTYIPAGELTVGEMFNVYRFENYLYTMRLTGKMIRDELEMSYNTWVKQMSSPADGLLLLNDKAEDDQHAGFQNMYFNFDSAAGINYTVDVTKPYGQMVSIQSLADGTPFDYDKEYEVAINSYRGNGGGDLLTKGTGLTKEEIAQRIVRSTDKDLRYYLIQQIKQQNTISPKLIDNWKFIPESWTKPAAERDRRKLFRNK